MLNVNELRKSYGQTRVLDSISFDLPAGTMLGVLGENGAGKSTLMKILAGSVRADSGTITIDGQHRDHPSTRDALRAGIVLVPQELAQLPDLSVAENILLGRLPTSAGVISRRAALARAAEFAERMGLEVDVRAPMKTLSLADSQLVEIAKALARDASLLLLDEPTAALSEVESNRLFEVVKRLRRDGVAVICISHRLDEVMAQSDQVLVLRDGMVAAYAPPRDLTKDDVVYAMLGQKVQENREPRDRAISSGRPAAVQMSGVSHRSGDGLDGVDAIVESGEIVGIFSVRGGGQEAFVATLVGLAPHTSGSLHIGGVECPPLRTPRKARLAGISFVPADRKRLGLALTASVQANLSLPVLTAVSRNGIIVRARERDLLSRVAQAFRLRFRNARQPVKELSGGNQQKILIGGRLESEHDVLVLHEPTRGVDIGARQEIHRQLLDHAAAGTSIILATTDVDEVVSLATRVYILRGGAVVAELRGRQVSADAAIALAVGDTP